MTTAQFTVLYRWRLKPGAEQRFRDAWESVSRELLSRGSLGSRLHRADDGTFVSYAQWPSSDARQRAFEQPTDCGEAHRVMADSIAESFDEIILVLLVDLLVAEQ